MIPGVPPGMAPPGMPPAGPPGMPPGMPQTAPMMPGVPPIPGSGAPGAGGPPPALIAALLHGILPGTGNQQAPPGLAPHKHNAPGGPDSGDAISRAKANLPRG